MSRKTLIDCLTESHFNEIKFDELGAFEVTDERLLELVSAGARLNEVGGPASQDINLFCPITNSEKGCGGSPEGSS